MQTFGFLIWGRVLVFKSFRNLTLLFAYVYIEMLCMKRNRWSCSQESFQSLFVADLTFCYHLTMLIIVNVLVMGTGDFSHLVLYMSDSPTHLRVEMRQPKLENIEGRLSATCFAEYLHKSSYSFPTVTLWWSRWYPHLQVRAWAQKLNNVSSIIAKKWYSWGQTQDLFYLHYAKMIVKNSKVKGVY